MIDLLLLSISPMMERENDVHYLIIERIKRLGPILKIDSFPELFLISVCTSLCNYTTRKSNYSIFSLKFKRK